MHMIGQQGDNIFSSLTKMQDHGNADPNHPGFGLKRDLIRLLANMAYKKKTNQDKVISFVILMFDVGKNVHS